MTMEVEDASLPRVRISPHSPPMNGPAPTGRPSAREVRPRAPIMADVARLAGVSLQTVSRVVNGHDSLRVATRERVEQAIHQLGYRPNSAARTLVTKRSSTIGVIGQTGGAWGLVAVHREVAAMARGAGYFVSSVDLESRVDIVEAVEQMHHQGFEGIILVGPTPSIMGAERILAGFGVLLVVVEGDPSANQATIGLDQQEGGRLAGQHLIDLGHTRILHVAGPGAWAETHPAVRGWRHAIQGAGLRPLPCLVGDWTAASGYHAGLEVADEPGVSGVFCANDQMAMGMLHGLHEAAADRDRWRSCLRVPRRTRARRSTQHGSTEKWPMTT